MSGTVGNLVDFSLPQRMLEAARTLEEASALYGYIYPQFASWTAEDLRKESEHVELGNPSGLYAVDP